MHANSVLSQLVAGLRRHPCTMPKKVNLSTVERSSGLSSCTPPNAKASQLQLVNLSTWHVDSLARRDLLEGLEHRKALIDHLFNQLIVDCRSAMRWRCTPCTCPILPRLTRRSESVDL